MVNLIKIYMNNKFFSHQISLLVNQANLNTVVEFLTRVAEVLGLIPSPDLYIVNLYMLISPATFTLSAQFSRITGFYLLLL